VKSLTFFPHTERESSPRNTVTAYNDTTGALDAGARVKPTRPRAALIVFFLVSFGIPWATWIALRIRHTSFTEGPPLALMVGGAFCSVGGVVATYIEKGRSGLRDLAQRCVLYRVSVAWWLYALFLVLGVHVAATVIYAAVHGGVGPVRPLELLRQWWLLYMFVFGLFQGPLAEELGWRGFLLPRLLNDYSPLQASVILGLIGTAWHINVFFSPIPTVALFTASLVAVSILMTVMFLHTRGSVLLAIVMHWSIVPGKDIARISFPAAQEPPDWLRAVVGIAVALIIVVATRGKLSLSD
jgi:membrane protease YdiL (CAAX protease family)